MAEILRANVIEDEKPYPVMVVPVYRKKMIVGYAQMDTEDYYRFEYVKKWTFSGGQVVFRGRTMQRLIMESIKRYGFRVCHIDGNPLNNKKSNLRIAY